MLNITIKHERHTDVRWFSNLIDAFARADGPPPPVDLVVEKRNGDFVRSAIRNDQIRACHDLSDGGLAIALAEMCMASHTGATVTLGDGPAHAELFGEDQARYLVAVSKDMANWITLNAEGAGVPYRRLGTAGGERVIVSGLLSLPLEQLREAHESWFPRFMDGPAQAEAAE